MAHGLWFIALIVGVVGGYYAGYIIGYQAGAEDEEEEGHARNSAQVHQSHYDRYSVRCNGASYRAVLPDR